MDKVMEIIHWLSDNTKNGQITKIEIADGRFSFLAMNVRFDIVYEPRLKLYLSGKDGLRFFEDHISEYDAHLIRCEAYAKSRAKRYDAKYELQQMLKD